MANVAIPFYITFLFYNVFIITIGITARISPVKMVVLLMFMMPSLIIGVITYYLTKNRVISLLFASIANFCIIGIMIIIIDKLFARLEMV